MQLSMHCSWKWPAKLMGASKKRDTCGCCISWSKGVKLGSQVQSCRRMCWHTRCPAVLSCAQASWHFQLQQAVKPDHQRWARISQIQQFFGEGVQLWLLLNKTCKGVKRLCDWSCGSQLSEHHSWFGTLRLVPNIILQLLEMCPILSISCFLTGRVPCGCPVMSSLASRQGKCQQAVHVCDTLAS